MKKSFKLFLAMLLIGGFALSFSSCKDSENASNDPNSPENAALSKLSESAQGLLNVLSYTSGLDSLPDNWASNSYTVEPNVGVVKDESTPYVRYIVVNDKQEAIDTYNAIAEKTLSKDATSDTWNIENVGNLSFKVLDQSDVTATLDINIKQQPHLTQIRFVPASAIGDNAWWGGLKVAPYYQFGDVISLQEGDKKTYWICARPCSQISNKKQSHWFSFNLIDKPGTEGSNTIQYNNSGYETLTLPTNLGNKSESLQHLKNLFKLLLLIDDPTKYSNAAFANGLGDIKKTEFTQEELQTVSSMWAAKDLWKTISPSQEMGRSDFQNRFNAEKEVNVFYHGYSYQPYVPLYSNPSVWMATLKGTSLETESRSGSITWKRTVSEFNFMNYATIGYQNKNMKKVVQDLPLKGFVVRYKSGAELVDATKYKSSSNDPEPGKSLHEQNSNIEDVYTYKSTLTSGEKSAVIGDVIYNKADNTGKQTNEICVLNSTETTNFESVFVSNNTLASAQMSMAGKKIATLVNLHILNALILHSDKAKEYVAKYPMIFTDAYKKALNNFYNSYKEHGGDITQSVSFYVTGPNNIELPAEIKGDQEIWYSIVFPFDLQDNNQKNTYQHARLIYSTKTRKYSLVLESKTYTRDNTTIPKALNITSYKDLGSIQPDINTSKGQTFKKITVEEKERKEMRQALAGFAQYHNDEIFN